MGIIGHYDTECALQVPGVELVAVADLYQGRLDRAKEKWGNQLFTTRDYRQILSRSDVDAVLVCTSDHWHDRISIDAMNAGKHVYCEKPMVHHIEEGHAVIAAQKRTGKVFQVGSQRASSVAILEARKQLQSGIIGELTFVEATCDRSSANGAWQYTMPTDASAKTIDWDTYLGDAPKVAFDATRFFRWRNYKDYGTGVAGDLFVHLITGLHTMTGALGPKRIFALGDLTYWKDGRDAYDLVNGVMEYAKTEKHPAFQFVTRVNLADGGGGSMTTRLVGTEGVIEMGWNDFKIKHFKRPIAPDFGGYDSVESFPKAMQESLQKQYDAKYSKADREWKNGEEIKYAAPENYDDRYDHMISFFSGIRENKPILEDATFGLRAAGPSLACNLSAERGQMVHWDPVTMKVLSK
jgi:predicted dehydrogenase